MRGLWRDDHAQAIHETIGTLPAATFESRSPMFWAIKGDEPVDAIESSTDILGTN